MSKNKSISTLPAEGAKYIYIMAGPSDTPIKVMCNLNCELQLVLNHAKIQILKGFTTRITEEYAKTKDQVVDENEATESKDCLDKLIETKLALEEATLESLDLIDAAGTTIQCAPVIKLDL